MAANNLTLSFLVLVFVAIFAGSNAKTKLGHLKESEMTLYLQDYTGGPNATVIEIPGPSTDATLNFTKFGAVFCADDAITDQVEESLAPIARGRDLYVISALDASHALMLMSIDFVRNEYNGSSLQIQGSYPQFEQVSEVAVVGGTGKFRLARGYATFETLKYDSQRQYTLLRCNITVLHY